MNRDRIIDFLDKPNSKYSKIFAFFIMFLIYLSILNATLEEKYSDIFIEYSYVFNCINYFILFIFTIELLVRLIFDKNRIKYFLSFHGVIDILAVVPELVGALLLGVGGTIWIRVFKLFRIVRILKVIRMVKGLDGITGKLLPFIAIAIGLKGVMVMFESYSWWPDTSHLTIVISVVAFSLTVLLSTKLTVVNNGIYHLEDALSRIIGSLRDMQNNKSIKKDIKKWAINLELTLKSKDSKKEMMIKEMRRLTDKFEEKLELNGIDGPNTSSFHKDVSYLLHRAATKTPENYDKFLKTIIIVYTSIVILVVPGLTGLISTVLLVYVLGGMYFIIEDMDEPLSYSSHSYIDAKLDVLEDYNKEFK